MFAFAESPVANIRATKFTPINGVAGGAIGVTMPNDPTSYMITGDPTDLMASLRFEPLARAHNETPSHREGTLTNYLDQMSIGKTRSAHRIPIRATTTASVLSSPSGSIVGYAHVVIIADPHCGNMYVWFHAWPCAFVYIAAKSLTSCNMRGLHKFDTMRELLTFLKQTLTKSEPEVVSLWPAGVSPFTQIDTRSMPPATHASPLSPMCIPTVFGENTRAPVSGSTAPQVFSLPGLMSTGANMGTSDTNHGHVHVTCYNGTRYVSKRVMQALLPATAPASAAADVSYFSNKCVEMTVEALDILVDNVNGGARGLKWTNEAILAATAIRLDTRVSIIAGMSTADTARDDALNAYSTAIAAAFGAK